MRGQYQGGSLAGFIIIGVVLALVLVGGLYGLNRYNSEQSKEVATDTNKSEEQSSEKKASESDSKSEETSSQPASGSSSKEDKSKTADESKSTSEATKPSKDELPVTGPADTFVAMLAMLSLGFATAHYIQSRLLNR